MTGGEVNDAHHFWNYDVNALLKSTGRVRVFGGAGLGVSYDDNDYSQQSFRCSPSSDLRICDEFQAHYDRGGFIFRALGGVEIPITPRIGITSSIRAEAAPGKIAASGSAALPAFASRSIDRWLLHFAEHLLLAAVRH